MKSKLLLVATLCAVAFTSNAQTKGTNALSFGITSSSQTSNSSNSSFGMESKIKLNSFTLGYGHFITDNSKIGLELAYGRAKYEYPGNQSQNVENYGANASYQKYFPIVKTLFAYAGGKAGYAFSKDSYENNNTQKQDFNAYSAGAYGGLTWFVSKRFAFETNLLSANAAYSIQKRQDISIQNIQETTSTNFNITTQGFINDLGFKIYLLF